jgi:hypothetical protein
MRRPRDVALFPFAITVITPESHPINIACMKYRREGGGGQLTDW